MNILSGELKPVASDSLILFVKYVLFADDVTHCLKQEGHEVHWLEASQLRVGTFVETVRKYHPRCLMSINFSPELAFLATQASIPYLSWTVDPLPEQRFALYPNTDVKRCVAFAHSLTMLQRLRGLNISSHLLPLAAPVNKRFPVHDDSLLEPLRCDVSFVGDSLLSDRKLARRMLAERGATPEAIEAVEVWAEQEMLDQVDHVTEQWSWDGMLDEVPPKVRHIASDTLKAAVADILSWQLRRRRIKALSGTEIAVYGDRGWRFADVDYRGFAEHERDVTSIYAASDVNLDLPRFYQRNIVTMRVFDALATRSLVLTEHTEALQALFEPGKEVLTYCDTGEMVEKVNWAQNNRDAARRIADAGYARVLQEHTLAHRVSVIQRFLDGF